MNVQYDRRVLDYLDDLIDILYKKEYFGFEQDAVDYVERITNAIETSIYLKPKKAAPRYFSKYGKNMYYVTYRPNRRTTWYIFFNVKDKRYIVRYITNNHISGQHIKSLV